MSLQKQIRDSIKEAMLAKDSVRLTVLRGLTTAFTNELVAKGKTPQDELADEDAIAVIRRNVKQRRDAIEQFNAGGRADLAEEETAELTILETYLPKLMSKDEIRLIAEAKKTEMGITDKTKIGMFMGVVMKDLKGRADGNDVKEVIESLFN